MTVTEFKNHVTNTYEVSNPNLIIEYSSKINYECYVIVNGDLVDLSGYEWNDHDGFLNAVITAYYADR